MGKARLCILCRCPGVSRRVSSGQQGVVAAGRDVGGDNLWSGTRLHLLADSGHGILALGAIGKLSAHMCPFFANLLFAAGRRRGGTPYQWSQLAANWAW